MRTFHRQIQKMFRELSLAAFESEDNRDGKGPCRITRHAIDTIHHLLVLYLKYIARLGHEARLKEGMRTLLVRHITFVCHTLDQSILPVEDALMEFDAKQGLEHQKHARREQKAELNLSASLCERYLREGSDALLDAHAVIAATAMIESFCRMLLPPMDIIQHFLNTQRRVTLKTTDLMNYWDDDNSELQTILSVLRSHRPARLGYNPDIHGPLVKRRFYGSAKSVDESLEDDLEEEDSHHDTSALISEGLGSPDDDDAADLDEDKDANEDGSHEEEDISLFQEEESEVHRRRKPGRLAQIKIRHYQKNQHRLLQKQPFDTFIREWINRLACRDVRFYHRAMRDIQCWVEDQLVSELEHALALCEYARRETCRGEDLEWIVMQRHGAWTEYPDSELPSSSFDNGLRRLCYRAGIVRQSPSLLESLKSYMMSLITQLVMFMVHYINAVNINTVSHELVTWAIDHVGH